MRPSSAFSARTFELFELLGRSVEAYSRDRSEEPPIKFYKSEKDDFETYVIQPTKALLRDVVDRLPRAILDVMETERNVFSRIPKNDWGQGWTHLWYWGALYPKGRQRLEDVQLIISVHADKLEYGFRIGERGDKTQQFGEQWSRGGRRLVDLLGPHLSGNLQFRLRGARRNEPDRTVSWNHWATDPHASRAGAVVFLPRDTALATGLTDLRDQIVTVFRRVFPLVIVAGASGDPLPQIEAYLHG
jgi:5-methylcytosine-specific restriction protein B